MTCIEVTCLVFSMVVVILLHTDKVATTGKSEKWVLVNGFEVSALGMRVAGLVVTVKEHVDIRMGIAPTTPSEFIFIAIGIRLQSLRKPRVAA